MTRLKNLKVVLSCFVLMIQSSCGSGIIGGKKVPLHSMPYMVLLEPYCGGTLIHPQWVLTAAHCQSFSITNVELGVNSIKNKMEEYRQVIAIAKQIPHPFYDEEDDENDLMLLKLSKPAIKSKGVSWIKPERSIKDPKADDECLVAGWGETNENEKEPKLTDVLRSVTVRVVDRDECNMRYNLTRVITRRMVCAGWDGNKKADTCGGDSGGPLLCGKKELVGVTSFGHKCGDPKKPGVYAFLTEKQLKWIDETIHAPDV